MDTGWLQGVNVLKMFQLAAWFHFDFRPLTASHNSINSIFCDQHQMPTSAEPTESGL